MSVCDIWEVLPAKLSNVLRLTLTLNETKCEQSPSSPGPWELPGPPPAPGCSQQPLPHPQLQIPVLQSIPTLVVLKDPEPFQSLSFFFNKSGVSRRGMKCSRGVNTPCDWGAGQCWRLEMSLPPPPGRRPLPCDQACPALARLAQSPLSGPSHAESNLIQQICPECVLCAGHTGPLSDPNLSLPSWSHHAAWCIVLVR